LGVTKMMQRGMQPLDIVQTDGLLLIALVEWQTVWTIARID
jgi:hypothetical protein